MGIGRVSVFGSRWCGWIGGLDQGSGRVGLCYICVSFDFIVYMEVQVSVYCARCTQCSILLHLIEICFLTCICVWKISLIQTCLCVVLGPGFVLTSPAFMMSSASHAAGLRAGLPKTINGAPNAGGG